MSGSRQIYLPLFFFEKQTVIDIIKVKNGFQHEEDIGVPSDIPSQAVTGVSLEPNGCVRAAEPLTGP